MNSSTPATKSDLDNAVQGLQKSTKSDLDSAIVGLQKSTRSDLDSAIVGLQKSTKSDLDNAVQGLQKSTKSDLDNAVQGLQKSTKSEIELSRKATKDEFRFIRKDALRNEERIERLEDGQNLMNSKLDRIMNTLDGFVGSVDTLRDENEIGTHQTRELQLKVEDHEERLTVLESAKHSS